MSSKADLRLDWATHAAAKYAVEHWHYSRTMPTGKLLMVAAYEAGDFIGVVLFGRGANNNIGKAFLLGQTEVVELVRVALKSHISAVTRIISVALNFLRRHSPGIRLVVSYADPEQGHNGGIYQGGNWAYVGKSQAQREVMVYGEVMHKRTAHSRFGTIKGLAPSPVFWKHKYLFPLDTEMRARILPLSKPYPKRDKQPMAGDQPAQGRGSADHHAPILAEAVA